MSLTPPAGLVADALCDTDTLPGPDSRMIDKDGYTFVEKLHKQSCKLHGTAITLMLWSPHHHPPSGQGHIEKRCPLLRDSKMTVLYREV